MVRELKYAGLNVTKLEKKKAHLRELPKDFHVTAETIMDSRADCQQVFSKLLVREMRLQKKENAPEQALLIHHETKESRSCSNCGKRGHIAKNGSSTKKMQSENNSRNTAKKCFKCGKSGHFT